MFGTAIVDATRNLKQLIESYSDIPLMRTLHENYSELATIYSHLKTGFKDSLENKVYEFAVSSILVGGFSMGAYKLYKSAQDREITPYKRTALYASSAICLFLATFELASKMIELHQNGLNAYLQTENLLMNER